MNDQANPVGEVVVGSVRNEACERREGAVRETLLIKFSSMGLGRYKVCFQIDISDFKLAPLPDERHILAPVFAKAEKLNGYGK